MPKLPTVSGSEAIGAFCKAGFVVDRTESSHSVLKKPGHRFNLSVPVHGKKSLGPGLLRRLIRDAGIDVPTFIKNLE